VQRHKEIGEEFKEEVEGDITNVMPENVWSTRIVTHIGTPASDHQRLYFIHNMPGEMKDKLAPPTVEYHSQPFVNDSEARQTLTL
jgi:hypothetical protein